MRDCIGCVGWQHGWEPHIPHTRERANKTNTRINMLTKQETWDACIPCMQHPRNMCSAMVRRACFVHKWLECDNVCHVISMCVLQRWTINETHELPIRRTRHTNKTRVTYQ